MKSMNRTLFALVLLLFVIAACGPTPTAIPAEATSQVGVANPASVYCVENHGRLEIRTGADGGQIGICVFDDGSECEEWAYFRGECQPGATMSASTTAPASASPASVAPVVLQVLLPQDGSVSDLAECQVIGTTSPGAVVTVNAAILIADGDGNFQTTVTLEAGLNLIEVVASNSSGSEASVNVTVTYQP